MDRESGVNERKVLLLLNDNSTISAGDIAEGTGLGKRGVEKQLFAKVTALTAV